VIGNEVPAVSFPRSLGRFGRTGRRRSGGADPAVVALIDALGVQRVRVDGAERFLMSRDASVFTGGVAGPVCFPSCTADVQAIMTIAARFDRAVVPRGAGTGLAGGAIPLGAPIVVAMTRMNAIGEVDIDNNVVWVEPGVINLDLSKQLRPLGFHFAPDPSSQQVCTIGGNVSTNSGGPHCLAYGVTSHHVVALEVVLPDGSVVELGGLDAEPAGFDLRGAFVGGEGTLGIVTRVAVKLTPNPEAVQTLLLAFDSIRNAADTVGAVIAAGIVPAAMEVMDQRITVAVERFCGAGYPTDAAAVLLAELDGPSAGTVIDADRVAAIGRTHGATSVRVAADDEERARLWKGRKTAFGAVAQIAPSYYLHDTVVPRSALADVLTEIYAIAQRHEVIVVNVFHAGDGNLHPLLLFDDRVPGTLERVHAAGAEIVEASLAAGGALSGEHGIGVEKQPYMHLMFNDDDLDHQNRLRRAFDPHCRCNPGKVLPSSHSCADIASLLAVPADVWV
jgi:glycolate oxidase